MYSASNYRSMARRALKNYWWLAVGVTLLASLLGGTSSGFTPSFSLTVNGDDLTQYYPEALRQRDDPGNGEKYAQRVAQGLGIILRGRPR